MPDTAPQEQQTRSSASDLAAARERLTRVANGDAVAQIYWGDDETLARDVRILLGDGDDSARWCRECGSQDIATAARTAPGGASNA